jgi:hypothetical protein
MLNDLFFKLFGHDFVQSVVFLPLGEKPLLLLFRSMPAGRDPRRAASILMMARSCGRVLDSIWGAPCAA